MERVPSGSWTPSMNLTRQQTSLTCRFYFPKLDHAGVFILCARVYACTLFEISRPLNGENKTNKLLLCILRPVYIGDFCGDFCGDSKSPV